MEIPNSVLKLRKRYKSYGDNIKIAALASKIAGEAVNPGIVSKCFNRKDGPFSLVTAIEKYYTDLKEKDESIQSLSNIELSQ
jgi:hypothetical protein